MVGRQSALWGKLALNVEDFYVKNKQTNKQANNRVGFLKIIFLTMKHGKVGYFHVKD